MVPELVCDEDDPPFQKQGGKNTEQVTDAERREERLKVHVFETGVQRAAQLDHLPGSRSGYEGGLARIATSPAGWPSGRGKGKGKNGKQKGLGKKRKEPRRLGRRRYNCREASASHSTT